MPVGCKPDRVPHMFRAWGPATCKSSPSSHNATNHHQPTTIITTKWSPIITFYSPLGCCPTWGWMRPPDLQCANPNLSVLAVCWPQLGPPSPVHTCQDLSLSGSPCFAGIQIVILYTGGVIDGKGQGRVWGLIPGDLGKERYTCRVLYSCHWKIWNWNQVSQAWRDLSTCHLIKL